MVRRARSAAGVMVIAGCLLGMVTCVASGAEPLKDVKLARHKLYTKPDPSSSGGISGTIVSPPGKIWQILAIPPDTPRFCYKGTVSGSQGHTFHFSGLPMGKYNLLVVYEKAFYEGLRLHRDRNTLTTTDRRQIEATIRKSEPFFKKKIIHRLEGTTGRGNFSRCICTYLRNAESETYSGATGGFRRTFKIVILKQVGPGWQIVRSRDLFPLTVRPENGTPQHYYRKALSGIRVADYVKELGEIKLR